MPIEELFSHIDRFGPVAYALVAHPYWFIFFGLLVAGETIFLPAVYLALQGAFPVTHIVYLMIGASLLSDFVWYVLGRIFSGNATLAWMPGTRMERTATRISSAFKQHGEWMLFLSKFVYGTRTVVQALSGVYKMPPIRYIGINLLGTATLGIAYVGLIHFVAVSLQGAGDLVSDARIVFALFVVCIVVLHVAVRYGVRKWYQS